MFDHVNADKTITIKALTANLPEVLRFIDGELGDAGCSLRDQMMIDLAVEELFVNIAKYAYAPGTGDAVIGVRIMEDPHRAEISFADSGVPYDPFSREDPDITLPAEERAIGGLGIFMVKKSMDDMAYEYRDGHNIVRITKSI